MLSIGDKVTHIDYPRIPGTIVYKMSKSFGTQQFLVLWDGPRPAMFGGNVRTSRHIWSALRKA
jgi:hypothetical protein